MDDPTPSDQVSLGDYPNGTVFRLVRGIRGSSYSVGDRFMLIAEEDCHSPNTLKLGGMGEGFFIDPAGQPLKIEADESQFRVIFEAVVESPTPEVVLTEGETVDPDPKLVTEENFSEFRKGLAGVLTEIAAIRTERGERGPRGYTGVQGDRGERGEPGPQGEDGAVGAQGEPGPQGEVGPQGPQGPQGERGQRGEPGARGADGKQGTVGPMGPQGPQGERGPQGAPGVAGTMGPRGEAGTQGIRGKDGADGKDGRDGADGKTGKAGPRGTKGDRGSVGARGEAGPKGDRGSTGESGVLTAKFPLVYDADEKSIAIDEERLDKILKRIMGGGKVSPQDMGWLASTGGGGKVAVYINGSKITPDVRTLDFTGAGVTASKVGGKVTVNITGGGGVTGPTGPAGATGPTGATGATGDTPTDYVASFNGVTGAVQGVCAAVAGTGISVSGATGTVTITNTGVQSFNGVTGAVQGVSSFNGVTGAVHAVTELQGKSGPIGVCGGRGINIPNRIIGTGNTFAVSLNYLSGGVAMSVEKIIDKDHFIAFQDDVTQAMYISKVSNLSHSILGASASSFTSGESSTFLRMSRNIDDGNATTTDEYISVKDFFASSTIDGGTFA